MSSNYYIRFRGEVSGPVSDERLSELVRVGTLTALHEVSIDQARWITVRAWLIARNTPPPIPHLTPPSAAASSHFRINADQHPGDELGIGHTRKLSWFSGTALGCAILGFLANMVWIGRTHVIGINSSTVVTVIMLTIPALFSLAALTLGVLRLTFGRPRTVALIALLIAVLALGTTGFGIVLEVVISSTSITINDAPTLSYVLYFIPFRTGIA